MVSHLDTSYRRPSLKSLSTFEAAARHESFKGAGEELCLTPSAISHQVRQLESHLGINLFHRLNGGLAITDAGAAYLTMLTPAFAKIDEATKNVMQFEFSDELTIRSAPSFAKKWLLERLPDFLQSNPDIDVKVMATSENLDFRKNNIDIGIFYGQSNWPGYVVKPLFSEHVLPMCSPDFKNKMGELNKPEDLPDNVLIQTERNIITWKMRFAEKGITHDKKMSGVCLDPSELAIEAAVQGVGIILESDLLAKHELQNGLLVPAFDETVYETISYYLIYLEDCMDTPKITAFSNWITHLAGSDQMST